MVSRAVFIEDEVYQLGGRVSSRLAYGRAVGRAGGAGALRAASVPSVRPSAPARLRGRLYHGRREALRTPETGALAGENASASAATCRYSSTGFQAS
jgi:hypothetical protein